MKRGDLVRVSKAWVEWVEYGNKTLGLWDEYHEFSVDRGERCGHIACDQIGIVLTTRGKGVLVLFGLQMGWQHKAFFDKVRRR